MAKKEIEKEIKEVKTLEEWRELKMPIVYFKRATSSGAKKRWMVTSAEGIGTQPIDGQEVDFYNDKSWLFNSAKVLNKWAIGEPLTEEEFDVGIKRAADHTPAQRR